MSDIKFEIVEKIGVLSSSTSGWSKQPPPSFGHLPQIRQANAWSILEVSMSDLGEAGWGLERPGPQIRHPGMVPGWGEDGQGGDPVERRIDCSTGVAQQNRTIENHSLPADDLIADDDGS